MSPFAIETSLHWMAVGAYIVATVLFAHALIFRYPERVTWALWTCLAGLAPHSAALALRWATVGHGPYMMKHEVLSSNAWVAVVLLLAICWRRREWSPLALVVLPAGILMIGFGLFTHPEARDLPPTLRSIWLVFHILFTKLAVGSFLLSFAAAVLLLQKLAGRQSAFLQRVPDVDLLEAYMTRFVGFGFIFWSTTIVAGAIWANQSWGRYWGWDPIETWALVTWLCYGTLLHLGHFFRPGARIMAWLTVACFGVSLLTAFVFPFLIPSIHSAYFQ